MSAISNLTIDAHAMPKFDPSSMLTIRSNGHGTVTISVSPEDVQAMAEALLILTTEAKSQRAKSRVMIQATIKEARQRLRNNPGLFDYLTDDLQVLSPLDDDNE